MDDFQLYSDPTNPIVPATPTYAQRVRKLWDGQATYARQTVGWTTVQPTPADTLTWSAYDPMNAGLAAAGSEFGGREGIRLLPVVHGCPAEWADPTGGSGGAAWAYPRDDRLNEFGHYVAQTVKHFVDTHGNVTAVEIWNEPNLEIFGAVPYRKFASLINTSRDWIVSYKNLGLLPQHITIVTGGLSLTGQATLEDTTTTPLGGSVNGRGNPIPWENYLSGFQRETREHSAYHVGIHCYDLRENPADPTDIYTGADLDTAVMRTKQHILIDQFDQAKRRTHTRPIWVTETGCSSRAPWGLRGQSQVLAGLARGFALRSMCQAMLAYRLYPSLDPTFEPPTSVFHQFNVCNADNTNKNAYTNLADNWTEEASPS